MQTTNLNTISRIKKAFSLEARTLSAVKVVLRAKKENDASLVPYENLAPFAGISVIKSEMALASMGAVVAVVTNDMFGDPVIYVDDFFDGLSSNTQEFIMWHEIGHTKDKDIAVTNFVVGQMSRRILAMKGVVTREETFADDYALSMLGPDKTAHALNELLYFTSAYSVSGCNREVKLRLDRIQAVRRI